MYQENFIKTLSKAQGILENWQNRDLTLIGKITIINSLVNTLFVHLFLVLPSPPAEFFSAYRRVINTFLWGEK